MPGKPGRKKTSTRRADWDGAWKEAIQQLLPDCLELLFPATYALIDWNEPPVFLEQELRRVARSTRRGKQVVDKLVRVRLLDGQRATLLIHIEFQNQVDADLPNRLHFYNIGIEFLSQEPVATLVVLGDSDPSWRPAEYSYRSADFYTRMHFPVAKLLDYVAHWSALEQSANPFAVVVMAHLKALETLKKPESRLEWKLRLAKGLYDRNYTEVQVQQLVDFIDWLMVLDDVREARFDVALRLFEEEKTVPTLSPYQKRFIAKGRQEGIQEGRQEGIQEGKKEGIQEAVLENLSFRFDPVPDDIQEAVQRIDDLARLKTLLRATNQVTTLDEFRALL